MSRKTANQLQFGVGPQVPPFKVRWAYRNRGLIRVTCTRCGNWFVVKAKEWLVSSEFPTRPCPHCFKVSAIPYKDHKEKDER